MLTVTRGWQGAEPTLMMDEMDTEAEGEGEEGKEGEGEKGAVGVEGESEGREVELLLESMGWDVGGVGAEGC